MKIKIFLVLIFALSLGLLTRGYQFKERYLFAHDGDLASWIVKDIVVDHHLRLIGQLTSAPGIFIGPLFYYSLIPFYLLASMDPIGGVAMPLTIAILAILSLYYVVSKIHYLRAAGFAVLIYSASDLLSRTEREVVPTTPVMLWSIWCYYALNLVFQGKKSGLLLFAVLLGLVWHINLALSLVTPLFLVAFWKNRREFTFSDLKVPALIFIILSLPLIIFESRHGFIQTHALVSTLTAMGQSGHLVFLDKILHVLIYAARNATGIFFLSPQNFNTFLIPLFLLFYLLFRVIKKSLSPDFLIIFLGWMIFYILFFTFNSINLSEYYLNGINILWVILAGLLLSDITRIISLPLVFLFIAVNLNLLFSYTVNDSGYISKKALVEFIAGDSRAHGYPCISVSYITDPGYNFGYRYFFYLSSLHVNSPKSGSPVYSIVFPHKLVDHLDRTFGSLGLILPDYARYNESDVKIICQGPDENLTGDMFGFTR